MPNDTDDLNDAALPWEPDPLAVGDAVVVRLSGECVASVHSMWGMSPFACHGERGRVHTIWPDSDIADIPGHRYLILFDPPVPFIAPGLDALQPDNRWFYAEATFARAELERAP